MRNSDRLDKKYKYVNGHKKKANTRIFTRIFGIRVRDDLKTQNNRFWGDLLDQIACYAKCCIERS